MFELFNWFGSILGYLLWFLYSIVRNYGVSILLFTIIMKLLMFPFSIKQQRSMASQAKLQKKVKELQAIYGNDKMKLSEETQKLYAKEGASPTGGCLPMLIPFPILFGIYYSVLYPLQNAVHCSAEHVKQAISLLSQIPGLNISASNQYAEMDIIKATDTMCVNNPESNMGNAVGISPVLQLYKKGILIGLGTDAYTNDMLESIKVALCSQRHNACMPNVGWCEVTDMLFRNNARMAERTGFPTLGVLKPGAAADVIVMDYKPFTPFSDANIDGHMLFGMTGRQCQTTMINGRILMRDRVLTEIDEEAVNAHILESSKRLWGRLNHREY